MDTIMSECDDLVQNVMESASLDSDANKMREQIKFGIMNKKFGARINTDLDRVVFGICKGLMLI